MRLGPKIASTLRSHHSRNKGLGIAFWADHGRGTCPERKRPPTGTCGGVAIYKQIPRSHRDFEAVFAGVIEGLPHDSKESLRSIRLVGGALGIVQLAGNGKNATVKSDCQRS